MSTSPPDTLTVLRHVHKACLAHCTPSLHDIEHLLAVYEAHETHNMLCVTTGVLTEEDADLLTHCVESNVLPQYIMKYEYGFVIRRLVPETWYAEFKPLGLSSSTIALLQYIVQMGFDAVEFDCDGPILLNTNTGQSFPTFDW